MNDDTKYHFIKNKIKDIKTKVLFTKDLKKYLDLNNSDLSLFAISGYQSLKYLDLLSKNSKSIGFVNKESIVSAGHLFNKIFKNIKIYPLDSEHYSLFEYFKYNKYNHIKKIYLTASGGPFVNKKLEDFKYINFKEAIKHPKWKMGEKNSLDSSTMVNKCLEIIEANYLYNIPYNKLDVLVHPESLIHSIIEHNNFNTQMNYFYNDMFIPIFNYLNSDLGESDNFPKIKKYEYKLPISLNLLEIDHKKFPIYDFFKKIDKKKTN